MTSSRLIELVWLMLPTYCANMAPPFVKYWHGWNRPISRAYLGDHKTVAGFALGIVAGRHSIPSIVRRIALEARGLVRRRLMMGAGAMCAKHQMLEAAGAVRAHHDQFSRQTGGAFENVAGRLTTIDQDVQVDAGRRRRSTMGRDSSAEIVLLGVAGCFAGARYVEAGN